jgi:single-stranded-DNA-specific exonuclease
MNIQYKPINFSLLEQIQAYSLTLNPQAAIHPFLMDILSKRLNSLEEVKIILVDSLESIEDLSSIPELSKAVIRICQAIDNKELIGIQTDYDCDGQTAQVILVKSLTEIFGHPRHLIKQFVGRRLVDGYGVTPVLTLQILKSECSLVITADNGSSDIESLTKLQNHGVDVIITDHHLVNARPPCYAFVNPACYEHADRYLAGCAVAWMTMLGLQKYFKSLQRIASKAQLMSLLDLVAIGTLADCVSLRHSANNRILVKQGLMLIHSNPSIFIQSFKQEYAQGNVSKLEEEHITFYLSPLLNASSRVGDVKIGTRFLLEEDKAMSLELLNILKDYNEKRKIAQKKAIKAAGRQLTGIEKSIIMYIPESHAGINGIVASKILHKLQLTVAIFSPSATEGLVVGSIRVNNLLPCIKTLLDSIHSQDCNLIARYGGHSKAAGISLASDKMLSFFSIFKERVESMSQLCDGITWADTAFPKDISPKEVLALLSLLGPYGKEWERIVFFDKFTVEDFTRFGRPANHLRIKLLLHHKFKIVGIIFNPTSIDTLCKLLSTHKYLHVLGTLALDDYSRDTVIRIIKITDSK